MSNAVPVDRIEEIVGDVRHETLHIGRAVSHERQIYILHSKVCLASYTDLRECPFSRALDLGININEWAEDVPLVLEVNDGHLTPVYDEEYDEPVHACPPVGSNIMPCCGKTPFEVNSSDRMTVEGKVTCRG